MQLDRVEIDEADCFRWQAFPVTPLTAIFGANSTGKSTVLGIIAAVLSDADTRTVASSLSARLVMTPSQLDVPGHQDQVLIRDALSEALTHPGGFWPERPSEQPRDMESAPLEVLVRNLAAMLRQAFIRWGVASEPAAAMTKRAVEHLCLVYDERGARLAAGGVAAELAPLVDTLYFGAPAQDRLGEAVAGAIRSGQAHVPLLPATLQSSVCESARPHLIVVSLEPTDLLGRLRNLVDEVHDRVFMPGKGPLSDGRAGGADPGAGAGTFSDPWLETVPVPTDDDARGSLSGPRPSNLAYRERDSYRWVLQQLSRRANELAPSFVTDRGRIELSMWGPHRWGQYPERVRVTLEEGGERVDLRRLGSGLGRWVAASVRLACDDLVTPIIRVTREGDTRRVDAIPPGLMAGLASGLTRESVSIEPGNAPGIVLVDEPEAHLHPAAIRSVAEWLQVVSSRSLAVFVTTHHPILFEARTSLTTRLLVSRPHPELPMRIRDEAGYDSLKPGGQGSEIQVMERDILGSLSQMSDEIGLSAGELFLLTQLCLFVEGPHDVVVLNAFGKSTLDAAGVRVIPLHGADGAPALVSGEVVGHLGLRSCLILDGGSPERLSRERKAANRLLEEARRYGWDMTVIQLEVPDILWWLDADVVRRSAPEFPGWTEAWGLYADQAKKRRAKLSGSDYKTWLIRTYALSLSRDGVERLAHECREADRVPAQCRKLLHRISGLALSGRDLDTEFPSPPSGNGWSSPDLNAVFSGPSGPTASAPPTDDLA